jgi:hypothetical protein
MSLARLGVDAARTDRAGLCLLLALVVLLSSCDTKTSTRQITITRIAARPSQSVKLDATSEDRFGGSPGASLGGAAAAAGAARKPFVWDLPPGWKDRPDPQQRRVGSFVVGGNDDGDCSIALLAGDAGGVAANVNRWRKQMGLGALPAETVKRLPTRSILGRPATIVAAEGSYTGMGDARPRANFKLLGAILVLETGRQTATVFVKMVGPRALVDAESAHFAALCDSIEIAGHDGTPGAKEPASASTPTPVPARSTDGAPLVWDAPAGWKDLGPKPMRLVTFGIRTETECYVSVLPGAAGGVEGNLNRWRKQMGQPPLDAAGVDALPRVTVLGGRAVLTEASGNYVDMAGGKHAHYSLLGAIGTKDSSTVFLKMIGPEPEVQAERDAFLAFARSLR